MLRFARRLLSDHSASYRPQRQAFKIERVLSEALSSGQSAYWRGPRIHVHGVEMKANLRVAKVFCEPVDDLTRVPGGEERLRSQLERRRGFLSRLVNSHLLQKRAPRLDFVWVEEAPAQQAQANARAPAPPNSFRGRLEAAFQQLQAEADADAAAERAEAAAREAGSRVVPPDWARNRDGGR